MANSLSYPLWEHISLKVCGIKLSSCRKCICKGKSVYYIIGYTIEFLRDITGTEETPIDYVITYNTTVKSDSKYTAVNKGTLTIDGSSKTSQDSHPVSGITKGSVVEKYSYTNGTDEKESIVVYDKANNVFVYKVVLNGDFAYGDGDR